ncbi:hypothetical protein R3P38DRAFT_2809361 [Favolaschia claudopus]|uniref:Protection of telomeres protein 1 n=1 Tax=Favolaschia claudopus TaxID=2862362 RepID=A0AAV9ZDF6_9AGAR
MWKVMYSGIATKRTTTALGDSFRIKLSKYRASIMGRVHELQYEMILNPLALEGCPRDSSRVTLMCPPNVDDWTKELYERQIKTLEEIVAVDLQSKPGIVDQNWVQKNEDGTMVIKMLVCLPPDRLCAELPVGQDLDITVNLSKDEHLDGNGILHKRLRASQRYPVRKIVIGEPIKYRIKLDSVKCLYNRFESNELQNMADSSIAHRRLNSARSANLPLFGADILDQHYTSTRDGSLEDIDGPYSRFTYKPLIPQSPAAAAAMDPFRKDYSRYRAVLIVEIDHVQVFYHDNPLGRERNGRKCTRVTTRCPTGADLDTVKLFNMQVARLQEIIDADLKESPGEVTTSWLRKKPDGSLAIDLILMSTPQELAMRMDLVPGSDLEVTISLSKDEHFLEQETLSKIRGLRVPRVKVGENRGKGSGAVLSIKGILDLDRLVPLSATSMTDKDDNPVRRLVHVTNILRARNLNCDVFDFDYGAIRHSDLHPLGQRFFYVDFRRTESTGSAECGGRRESWSWYRPWVAGRVVKTEQQIIEHPILDSKQKQCTIVHLASAEEEDMDPSGYFYKQFAVLANIIRDENTLPYVKKITSWVNEEDNTIQVVQCNEDDYSKLRVGDCVMFLVYLTRDEYLTRSGEFKRCATRVERFLPHPKAIPLRICWVDCGTSGVSACSETADDTEREFFSKQVAVLQQVMTCDLHEDCNVEWL